MFNAPVISISQPLTSGPQEIVTFLRFLEQVPGVVVRKENNDLYHWETNSLIPYDIGNKVAQILNSNFFTCSVDDITHSWRYTRNSVKTGYATEFVTMVLVPGGYSRIIWGLEKLNYYRNNTG